MTASPILKSTWFAARRLPASNFTTNFQETTA